jgi:branched-chain amino acid transport system substrate-binding protein
MQRNRAMTTTRRDLGRLAVAAAATGLARPALAQAPREIKIGLVTPLSGAWAKSGELSRMGMEMAVDEVNEAGGIKSLGGARLRLVVGDCGDSPEKAKSAAQRLLSQEPDIVGGAGAYVSSFTLAVTEVTERAGVPWFTLSYADAITNRGFRYVYQTSPTAEAQAASALPTLLQLAQTATGQKPTRLGIVMDNTASPVNFTRKLRESGAREMGMTIVVDETFTPPLADAGPVMQRVRQARPEILLLLPTAVPDIKLTLEKLNEIGLGKGRLPAINNGGPMGSPDLLRVVGKDMLEGVLFITATWGNKNTQALNDAFRARTGEAWITQDSLSNYAHVMILRDALEAAASTDRDKLNAAIKAMDSTEGAAKLFPGGRIKFDERGRREGAALVIAQWQNGVPVTVFPTDAAVAQPIWPRR